MLGILQALMPRCPVLCADARVCFMEFAPVPKLSTLFGNQVPCSNGATEPARTANQPEKVQRFANRLFECRTDLGQLWRLLMTGCRQGSAPHSNGGISAAEADRLAAEVEAARTQRLADRPADATGDGEPGSEVDALDE